MQFDAVIFDMDGTLVNSEVLWFEMEGELLRRRGIEYSKEVHNLTLGMRTDAMLHVFKDEYGLDDDVDAMLSELMELMRVAIVERLQPKPGAQELVEYIAGQNIPYCIASSSDLVLIEAVIESQGWQKYFKRYFSAEQVENGKPEPDVFLLAAKQLGVSPKKCMVIEDSPNGVRAGLAAGMTVFAVPDEPTERPKLEKLTPFIFDTLHDIQRHLSNP